MDILTGLYVISGFAIVPLVIYGLYARIRVRQLYEKYSKEPVKKGITGSRLARTMLNSAGLNQVVIEEVSGTLGDHYDPRQNAVRLSRRVARNSSVAAIGIAAHEAAHAIQHRKSGIPCTAASVFRGTAFQSRTGVVFYQSGAAFIPRHSCFLPGHSTGRVGSLSQSSAVYRREQRSR